LNIDSFQKENGYYIRHYNSCGPEAIQDAMQELEKKIVSTKSISIEIQDNGNLTRSLFATIIHHNVLWVTLPHELKKYFTERNYQVTETSFSELKPTDVAIVLIKGRVLHSEWHWITHPTHSKKEIEKYYQSLGLKTPTSIVKVYLIKKRAAN
jgi:hypothetical protein